MTAIAEQSANTLLAGPGSGLPNDGTGTQSPYLKSRRRVRTDIAASGVIKLDPYLEPFQGSLKRRYAKAQEWIERLAELEGGVDKFSKVGLGSLLRKINYSQNILRLGHGDLRIQCRQGQQRHLPGMGAECRRGLAGWRFQLAPTDTLLYKTLS